MRASYGLMIGAFRAVRFYLVPSARLDEGVSKKVLRNPPVNPRIQRTW